MGLEITHLGSGSRGNATLLSTGETRVIVDCGFSLKQMEARLAMVGVEGSSVNAIVVSHHLAILCLTAGKPVTSALGGVITAESIP